MSIFRLVAIGLRTYRIILNPIIKVIGYLFLVRARIQKSLNAYKIEQQPLEVEGGFTKSKSTLP